VARFRQQLSKRPINSNKEIVDAVTFLIVGGVTTDIDILTTVDDYIGNAGTVPIGSSVNGFYLETSTQINDTILGRLDWYLVKRDNGNSVGNYPLPGATGGHPRRKFIFHESKGLQQGASTATLGGQTNRMREFIKVPKKFKRCAEADVWTIRVGASVDYSFCLKCIYKRYI